MITAVRSASGPSSIPESATASRAATVASCEKRAVRRARLGPRWASASKPWISPAIRTGRSEASNELTGLIPERPATSPSQVPGASWASGVIAPIPVITGSER